jgi:TolB-like protein
LRARSLFSIVLPLIAVAVTTFAIYIVRQNQTPRELLQDERIAVPAFTNLTGKEEFNTISKIAAHWITTELIESVHASVISYQSAVENTQTAFASVDTRNFSENTGAVNVITGAFRSVGSDSLEFNASIVNLKTGLHVDVVLPKPRCASTDPMECIQELAGGIKGFWESRKDHILRPPNLEAYKSFLAAREIWFEDPMQAEQLLRESIAHDAMFIDAYFLLLDWFYNQRQFEDAADMITEIKSRFIKLNARQ